jgi:hypothetical protein
MVNGQKVSVNNYDQSGRTSKKSLVIYFKVIFLDSPGGLEERNEKSVITAGLLVTKRGPPGMSSRWMNVPIQIFSHKAVQPCDEHS